MDEKPQPNEASAANSEQNGPCKDCAGNETPTAPGCNGSTDPHPGSSYSAEPVRYSNGEVFMVVEDLRFKSFGLDWGHTRSYSNQITHPGVGRNGNSWFVKEWPHLVRSNLDPLNPNTPGTICLVWVIQETLWFDYNAGTNSFVARFYVRPKLRHDATNKQFTLIDSEGRVTKFFDFDVSHPEELRGQFKSFTDAAGRETIAQYGDDDLIDSFVQEVGGQSSGYYYTYLTEGVNAGRLKEVRYEANDVPVRCAQYSYYGEDDAHGSAGDLELVTIAEWDGAGWRPLNKTYYRYYKEDGGMGVAHGLRFVLSPLGYQRMEEEAITPELATNEQMASFAKHEFRYDPATRRVLEETVNSGTANYGFQVTQSTFPDGFNSWKWKTVETLPDGNRRRIYTNFAGQVILSVFIEMQGNVETDRRWYDYRQYDGAGRTLLQAESSAVESYTETVPGLVTLHNTQGLIHLFEFYPASPGASGAPNRLRYEMIKEGAAGNPVKIKELQYVARTIGADTLYWPSKEIAFRSADNGGSDPLTTTYSYAWTHFQVVEKTMTLPVVLSTQNGSGVADYVKEAYDAFGRLTWRRDERGYITGFSYDPVVDALVQRVEDVVGGAPWPVLPGAHLNLITDYNVDSKGRTIQERGAAHEIDLNGIATEVRRTRWTVYHDATHQRWEANGFQKTADDSFTLINPVSIRRHDDASRLIDAIHAVRVDEEGKEDVDGPLLPTDRFAQSTWVRWTRNNYMGYASVANKRVYFLIPEDGVGTRDVNYNQSDYQYDILHRMVRDHSPGGTVTRYVYSANGWLLGKWIGTNDTGATDTDPAGGGSEVNNMVKVEVYQYDEGLAGKDGNLTKLTQYADEEDTRVTSYSYDWRNRRTSTTGEIDFFEAYSYDNLNQVKCTERRDTTSNGTLVGLSKTKYDNRGRVYRRLNYAVNPQTGAVGNALIDNMWFDAAGNEIKRQAAGAKAFIKTTYNAINRPVVEYLALDADETAYADASNVMDDIVIEQAERTYDSAGNVTFTVQRARFHNATGVGAIKEPTGAQPRARVTYAGSWPDALGRICNNANYGTNGDIAPTRPAIVPASSDDVLVTVTAYNKRGEAWQVIDPAGKVYQTGFDDAGRKTQEVQNVVKYGTASDENKTILFSYTPDGVLSTLTAQNSVTNDQVTTWNYGTTLEDSRLASTLLVRSKVYPDSPSDKIEFQYNRQGQRIGMTDQRGTVHVYDYDKLGRLLHDRVLLLGTNVDGAVQRISHAYDVRGATISTTSADNASPDGGYVVNQVLNTYNDFGQLIDQQQAHDGEAGYGTPSVKYAYADGSYNNTRLEKITYPDGRKLHYSYGASDSNDDFLNRVASLVDDDGVSHLVEYQYVGAGAFATIDYPQPGLTLTYKNDASDAYTGWDRFGRIVDQRWLKSGAAVERLQYGYDRSSFRVFRRNLVVSERDELYSYDGVGQLGRLQRGTLDVEGSALTGTPIWEEGFAYDPSGNCIQYKTYVDGVVNLDQVRGYNSVNEVIAVDSSSDSVGYDLSGNMTRTRKFSGSGGVVELSYDAWNRLVKITSEVAILAIYKYDGLRRRTTLIDSGGDVRHCYYSRDWQVLEERNGSDVTAERQFIWGRQHVDDLIIRDYFNSANQRSRIYAISDSLNVSMAASDDGSVLERYYYTAFGVPEQGRAPAVVTPELEVRFHGYSWDESSGFYSVRYRSLTTAFGRWLSRDPIEERGGVNLYAFVGNNPINRWDRFGQLFGLDFDYTQNLQIGGCLPIPAAPLVSICLTGGYTVTVDECCKDGEKKNLITVSGDVNIYAAIQAPSPLSVSYTKGVNISGDGAPSECPSKKPAEWTGSFFVGFNAGWVNGNCTWSPSGGWSCSTNGQFVPQLNVYGGGTISIAATLVQ